MKFDKDGVCMNPNIKIIEIAYHRNGVRGEGFDVVRFDEKGNGRMVAILFEGRGRCAVLEVDETAKDNIAFAMGNSWRGDDYEDTLRKAIADWENGEIEMNPPKKTVKRFLMAEKDLCGSWKSKYVPVPPDARNVQICFEVDE